MIRCKECGKENPKYQLKCPKCGAAPILADGENEMLLSEAEELLFRNDFLHAVEIYKFLAAAGSVDGERELGLILERGLLLPRDLEMAMQYFYSAAMKGDALSAYKYSRLVVGKQSLSDFWLAFAALMECKEAYPDAFAMYTGYKEKSTAAYYCSLMAAENDTDAIIEMARRHLYGDGVDQNERQAKWYIERIERAPLHAIKLQRRLQAVAGTAIQPDQPIFVEKKRIIEKLIDASKKLGYNTILLKLANTYAAEGDADANIFLAMLHIEGIEFTQNVERGISMLEESAENGSVTAAKYLGDIYSKGEFTERDQYLATYYYRLAAKLGGDNECESLGDIFYLGEMTEPDYALALSLYERGAESGNYGCQRKLKMMHEERERCYIEATRIERSSPDEAFKLFKKSVELGYLPAHARIGWYYERGIGTKVNRKAAYTHYKLAYDAGDKRAIESLGRCYARGIGVNFDFKKASELLSIAREMGSQSADKELYRIYENKKRHMIRSLYSTAMELYYNRKYATAIDMLELCMKLGLGDATYSIGCLYEFGITTEPDRKIALRYYKKAYEQGFSDPRQYHKQSMLRVWKQDK